MPNIYIDADACPVKDEAVRVATRYGALVYMVGNQGMRGNALPHVHGIIVGTQFDAADDWIADHIVSGDIVITADIQLAARCLEKLAKVIGPTGKMFTEANIGTALAMRELNSYLRDTGEIKGGNRPFSKQDRSEFLQALDRLMQAKR